MLRIVGQQLVDGVEDALGRPDRVLGFADVGSLAGQPQNDVAAAHAAGDVHGALRPVDGVLAFGRAVGGVAAVDGAGMLPEARGQELAEQALVVEYLLNLGDAALRFSGREFGGDYVVVVELHAVEAELLVFADLGREGDLGANRRAERVGAGADVPGAEGETVSSGRCDGGHSSILPWRSI